MQDQVYSTRELAEHPTLIDQSMHASWKPTNLRKSAGKELNIKVMKITLQMRSTIPWSQRNLVHNFIPMPRGVKIPEAKAAVHKGWENLKKMAAWQWTDVRSKKEVIREAHREGKKVHFAILMDICHLKNAELETQFQNCKEVLS